MWEIKSQQFDKEKIIHHGNQFLIGNLKLGIRGTLEEFGKNELVGLNIPFLYDQVDDKWREPVNAFNPLFTQVILDGNILNPLFIEPTYHEQSLNLENGLMKRKTEFKLGIKSVTIESERFVSLADYRMIVHKYQVRLNMDSKVYIETGIDSDIWEINGPHYENISFQNEEGVLSVTGTTQEKKRYVTVHKKIDTKFKFKQLETFVKDGKILNVFEFDAKKDTVYTFYSYAYVGIDEKEKEIINKLSKYAYKGFDHLLQETSELFKQKWELANIELEGDEKIDLALRYSIYHLLILTPNDHRVSIPARGISGQTYKGAVFWDTEIFMLPYYLNTNPIAAKSLIEYRIDGLEKAKEKAQFYGYKGAFYAWESQERGFDACTDYNVTDVFTNRLVRTYFKDKQVHISADIIYALKSYIEHTKDDAILKEGALEVLFEVARFFLDYGKYHLTKDRFEIWDVMGPDEYHERVHNNAFTNQMVKMVFDFICEVETSQYVTTDFFRRKLKDLDFEQEYETIKSIRNKVYIPQPNKEGIIEQFEGYFLLKDVDLEELLSQRLHPNEYLGGHGLAGDTKIIKQADVITLLYLFKDLYNQEIMEKNFDYYEPKTEHGSSLSASMYALVACLIGKPEYAYPHFIKSATIDLTGKSKHYAGGIYIGGTHPAANGGAYLTAVYGFAGLNLKDLTLKPSLPKAIKSLKFKVNYQGKIYQIFVSHDNHEIKEITG